MKIRTIAQTLLAASLVFGAASASAAEKIGAVNLLKLGGLAPQTQEIRDALVSEFSTKERELQARKEDLVAEEEALQARAKRDSLGLTTAQAQKLREDLVREGKALKRAAEDLQRDFQDIQQEARAREQQLGMEMQRKLIAHVTRYAKANGYDMIVGEGVLFATPKVDVTDAVLAQLKKEYAGK